MMSSYEKAQRGITLLKSAVYEMLKEAGENGLRNVDLGKSLGIYAGHIGHQGHIPRTVLELLRSEGVAEQHGDKKWRLVQSDHEEDSE
jgi:hypothetical protein